MRYLKVLGLVVVFFLVMLFFVDNQEAFSTRYPLTLNLRFLPSFTTETPVPCYYMLLACFLLGAVITLAMLIWDRVTLTARFSLCKMRANGLEKDLKRADKNNTSNEEKMKALNDRIKNLSAEIDSLKANLKEAEARAIGAERARAQNI